MVGFVLGDGKTVRPATVVAVGEADECDLVIALDGDRDVPDSLICVQGIDGNQMRMQIATRVNAVTAWAIDVGAGYDGETGKASMKPGTWHFLDDYDAAAALPEPEPEQQSAAVE